MKRFVTLLLIAVFCFNIFSFVLAENERIDSEKILVLPNCSSGNKIKIPVGNAEYIDIGDGSLIKISNLLTFSNQNEADAYVHGLKTALQAPIQCNPTIDLGMRTTHGNVQVSYITYNYLNTISLWVEYTTSGNYNTGSITYHNAYTTFTGFTLGIAWHQVTAHSEVTSSGKDIYASATGEISYYILIDGLIELGRESVNLYGYCYAVK